jgi:hypothetical protein
MSCRGDCNREPECFGHMPWLPLKQAPFGVCKMDFEYIRWPIAFFCILMRPWKFWKFLWLFRWGTFEEAVQRR